MINKEDITIILCGIPPYKAFNDNPKLFEKRVQNYLKYGNVLIGKYKESNHSCYDLYLNNKFEGISIVEFNDNPPHTSYQDMHPLFTNQINGIYQTMTHVSTKYVIRIRIDEYYEKLDGLIEVFSQDPNKYVGNNMGWCKAYPTYISDKHYMIRTDFFVLTLEKIREFIKNKEMISSLYSNEHILFHNMLKASRELFPKVKSEEFIIDRFDMACIEDVGEFVWSHHPGFNSKEYVAYDTFLENWTDINFLKDRIKYLDSREILELTRLPN